MKKSTVLLSVFIVVCVVVYLLIHTNIYEKSTSESKKNVLFITVDDLRPELGCYVSEGSPTNPEIHTPNIDLLAAKSLLLKKAYVQLAVCSLSRTSILTGRRPDSTRVYDLVKYFRIESNITTIPEYFKGNGYVTVGMGKIFHPGDASGNSDDAPSWPEPYYHAPNLAYWDVKNISHRTVSRTECRQKPLPDMQIVTHAIETLERLAVRKEKPFFMAIGFYRPHLPFVVPERFIDFYPSVNIKLPTNMFAPLNMPNVAWSYYGELRHYQDIRKGMFSGKINTTLPKTLMKNLRQYYYASVTYVDFLVGKVLKKLKELDLESNTIISFLGDHGWQLGEHGEWSKHTNFELAAHAPMMIHIPGKTNEGIVTEKLTEFVDLFPTLVDAAGLPPVPHCPKESNILLKVCTEGDSLMPLVDDPNVPWWKQRVFTQYPRGGRGIIDVNPQDA